jgi:hypothetical protein
MAERSTPPPPPPPSTVEAEVRDFWRSRHLPPADGIVGPPDAPLARLFEGSYVPGDSPVSVAQRAVVADIEARFLALTGWRVVGTLRQEAWAPKVADPAVATLLGSLGIWVGGDGSRPWDDADRHATVQGIVERLAGRGVIIARDAPLRFCLSCHSPRSPERTVYQEEVGDTYLVRFPLEGGDPPVEALAWLDAPWRILGVSALLINPDLSYATVQYRRRDATARLLLTRSSIDRVRSWLPGSELTLEEEHPGKELAGRPYLYPLRHEFPLGGSLPPPAGTLQAVPDVGDSGTGVVPLVPAHGGTDALIAGRLGVPGWPLLTPQGRLDPHLTHKYAGLDLATANEFVARDLTDSGAVLARLRVLRGVPYCALCGHPLVWMPGRAWCLEPGRLPPEQKERYARLLPHDRPIAQIEVTPWPVSLTATDTGPEAFRLSECGRCDKLGPPGEDRPCSCGGTRRTVTRRLLPSAAGTFGAWARNTPLNPADSVRIFVGERRKVPAVVHHLAALTGMNAAIAEVRLSVLPTVPELDLTKLLPSFGADALRAALARTDTGEAATGGFAERCRQEARRLARFLAFGVGVAANGGGVAAGELGDPEGSDRELEPEDRAVLGRWRRAERQVVGAYERARPQEAYRQVFRFVEQDLAEYEELVRPRIALEAATSDRRAAVRTLTSLGRSIAVALSPVAPYTAEAVHRALTSGTRSLVETEALGEDRGSVDEALVASWDRWGSVVRAADRFRREHRLAPGTVLAQAVLVLPNDKDAEPFRADRGRLERIARIARLEVSSPGAPWSGRRRTLVPVASEIERVYPDVATQIVHLLRRLPPRRAEPAAEGRGMTVVVHGVTRTITPEMFALEETLPERFVPVPFSLGEMYIENPAVTPGAPPLPPLSPDGFWLLRRLERFLRHAKVPPDPTRVAIVSATDPLASELKLHAEAIHRYLGLARFELRSPEEGSLEEAPVRGRTRSGARWSIQVPGLSAGARPVKSRAGRTRGRRVPEPSAASDAAADAVDYANEAVVADAQAIRDLGEELDGLLGAPLLGPSKMAIARDAGFRTLDELSRAPFEEVARLPGFGRPVAVALWTKWGRTAPPRPPRTRRPRPVPAEVVLRAAEISAEPAPTTQGSGVLVATSPAPIAQFASPSLAPPQRLGPDLGDGAVSPLGGVARVPPVPPPSSSPPVGPVAPASPPVPPPSPLNLAVPGDVPGAPTAGTEAQGFTGAIAPPPPPPTPPPPPPAGLEILVAASVREALDPFLDATAAGRRGIAIVRESPDRVRIYVGPRPVTVYWLTNLARERTVRPSDLAGFSASVRGALANDGVTAVFLEGIEYLTRIHGIDRVVEALRDLDREAKEREARIWLHLTPTLLSRPDLERILKDLGGPPELLPTPSDEPTAP